VIYFTARGKVTVQPPEANTDHAILIHSDRPFLAKSCVFNSINLGWVAVLRLWLLCCGVYCQGSEFE
jgi:hypothetical protein